MAALALQWWEDGRGAGFRWQEDRGQHIAGLASMWLQWDSGRAARCKAVMFPSPSPPRLQWRAGAKPAKIVPGKPLAGRKDPMRVSAHVVPFNEAGLNPLQERGAM